MKSTKNDENKLQSHPCNFLPFHTHIHKHTYNVQAKDGVIQDIMSKRAAADHELEQSCPHAAQTYITPSTSTSSSVQTYLQLQSLPDAALATVAEHLKPLDLIKGLQVVDRWSLRTFVEETKRVVLWTDCVVKDDPPPEVPTPTAAASTAPGAGQGEEGNDGHEPRGVMWNG